MKRLVWCATQFAGDSYNPEGEPSERLASQTSRVHFAAPFGRSGVALQLSAPVNPQVLQLASRFETAMLCCDAQEHPGLFTALRHAVAL